MSLLEIISSRDLKSEECLGFFINELQVGFVDRSIYELLLKYKDVFTKTENGITICRTINSIDHRTEAVNRVMQELHRDGIVEVWRKELIPVRSRFGSAELMMIERGAASILGVRKYGVFLNGYTAIDGQIHMWIAKRSPHKDSYPSLFDCMVGGAISLELSPLDTLYKESKEEAGLSFREVSSAIPVGYISYLKKFGNQVENGLIFVHDITLPNEFCPNPIDGEVDKFELWSMQKLKKVIETDGTFKYNCYPVVADFFVRHGIIDYTYPDYLDLIYKLRKH